MEYLSDPNFIWGLSFTDIVILASRTTMFDTCYNTKQGITQCFDQESKGYHRKGQKGLFMDFRRPQLAQASIWLAWAMELPPG